MATKALDVKVVIVGDGTVGKTCILITYTTHQFPEGYVPTIFDNYFTNVEYNQRSVTLSLWDTAGQEDYDSLRPLAYPNTDVFLLCFSLVSPSSFANVRTKWHAEITYYCPKAQVVLVGTKADLRNDREFVEELEHRGITPVTSEEGKQLAKDINAADYIECSALTQLGLDAIFNKALELTVVPVKSRSRRKCNFL